MTKLCQCAVPLLMDRIKQSMVSCRVRIFLSQARCEPDLSQEASVFFKKRAAIEEEYGKNLQKLARSTSEMYSMNDGKAGCVYLPLSRNHIDR
jgi:Rho GTPase-activating protein RGD1